MPLAYDKERFLAFLRGDLHLLRVWDERQRTLPAAQHDAALRSLFYTYVSGNSVAEREYADALEE